MCNIIPMMDLLNEMKERGHDVQLHPTVHCKLFEDNSGALEFARVAKCQPRTQHINARFVLVMTCNKTMQSLSMGLILITKNFSILEALHQTIRLSIRSGDR
jgi:hypothetical protein